MKRPSKNDYAPFYDGYVNNVTDDAITVLEKQLETTGSLLNSISEEKSDFRYAEGKWSIKELVGHLIDTERVMAFRALSFSRGEKQPLPGFDEQEYIAESNYSNRKFSDLISELKLLRKANLTMFKNFSEEMLNKRGIANNYEVTVLALLFIIAGHEAHHIRILKERYLKVQVQE
jgi:uncharacterized damage-inducible protein DinB